MIKKLAAILLLSAMTIIPLASSVASAKGYGCTEEPRRFRLGDIKLSIIESAAGGDYLLKFSKGDEELFACECAFKTHDPKTVPNTPLPNCRTLLAYCFSGGAHCCTTLFIATECGTVCSLDMADLGHTDGEVKFIQTDGAPGKVIKVQDWQFAYYGSDDPQFQLSFADSPAMSRLLVFDNGHWRADRIGEFSQFYSGLHGEAARGARASARRREIELTASLAIKAAYYNLMSGRPVEEATDVLNRLFPTSWSPKAGKIIQDINRAVTEFNPVDTIR